MKYRVVVFMRVEPAGEEAGLTWEEALEEMERLIFLQPEHSYRVEEIQDGDDVGELE